jgi:hypothetical protein
MSHEGVTLVIRLALTGLLIVTGAIVRTFIGPSRRRGQIMLVGMLGGMSFGVMANALLSWWLKTDASAVLAIFGMVLGWTAAWPFARRIPRSAS